MITYKLGVCVHAVACEKEARRLMASITRLLPIPGVELHVSLIDDLAYKDADLAKFNPARAKNIGIKKLLPMVDGICCVDVDYIIPPGLFEVCAYPVFQKRHLYVRRRDIDEADVEKYDWAKWRELPIFGAEMHGACECRGSFNFLSVDNWRKVGGWDERGYGFGGDDDLLHAQIARSGIPRSTVDCIPLVHVHHPLRQWSGVNARGEENLKLCQPPQPTYLEGT